MCGRGFYAQRHSEQRCVENIQHTWCSGTMNTFQISAVGSISATRIKYQSPLLTCLNWSVASIFLIEVLPLGFTQCILYAITYSIWWSHSDFIHRHQIKRNSCRLSYIHKKLQVRHPNPESITYRGLSPHYFTFWFIKWKILGFIFYHIFDFNQWINSLIKFHTMC